MALYKSSLIDWLQWLADGLSLFLSLPLVLSVPLAAWVFWQLYIYTMGLYRAKLQGRLKGFSLLIASPGVVVAFVMDAVFQFTVFSLVFLDPPRDLLVTGRLRRYMRDLPPGHWRRRWADYFCHHLLDPFDPTGAHCDSDEPALKA